MIQLPLLEEPMRTKHLCHAEGCTAGVPPELLFCLAHWRLVPKKIQRAVWQHFRPEQCRDKRPSREWLEAARAAIEAVALREHRPLRR